MVVLAARQKYFSQEDFSMIQKKLIPDEFHEIIVAIGEYSYGVTRIRVTLDDGSKYDDVFVAWGSEIVKVGTSTIIPFDPLRIVSVERQ